MPMDPLVMPSIASFICATIGRLLVMRFVLRPLAEAAVGEGAANAKLRRKFREAAWRATLYAVACGWAFCCVLTSDDRRWVDDSMHFWIGWPHHEITTQMLSIYAAYLGFYVHHMLFLFLDTRSSDFLALAIHHVITLTVALAMASCPDPAAVGSTASAASTPRQVECLRHCPHMTHRSP